MRMSAVRANVAQENVSFSTMGKNDTCADILSAAKRFVENVPECFGLRYFIRKCNVNGYKKDGPSPKSPNFEPVQMRLKVLNHQK
jgi:hypothetical protein